MSRSMTSLTLITKHVKKHDTYEVRPYTVDSPDAWMNILTHYYRYFRSSFILRTTCPQSSVTPPLAGPSGRRPPGMWQSPSRPPAVVVDLVWGPHTWHGAGGGNLRRPVSATRATSTLAYSNPSPSSHGFEMVKTDRRGLILTKLKQKLPLSYSNYPPDLFFRIEYKVRLRDWATGLGYGTNTGWKEIYVMISYLYGGAKKQCSKSFFVL